MRDDRIHDRILDTAPGHVLHDVERHYPADHRIVLVLRRYEISEGIDDKRPAPVRIRVPLDRLKSVRVHSDYRVRASL